MRLSNAAIIVAGIVYVSATCRSPDETNVSRTDPVKAFYDSATIRNAPVHCFTSIPLYVSDEAGYTQILAQGCRSDSAATTAYAYRDNEGVLRIAGRQYAVQPGQLATIADSLEREISNRFGRASRCPAVTDLGIHIERQLYWEADGYALMLLANAFELYPHVAVEIHSGSPGCSHWAGSPAGR